MTLLQLNQLDQASLKSALTLCCGSSVWVEKMMRIFPVEDEKKLLEEAEKNWFTCTQQDWREAFTHHPKIGDIGSLQEKFAGTGKWAREEQSAVKHTSEAVLQALKDGNEAYEKKFGYIFIVCASGKPAEEMLDILQARLPHAAADEIHIAMQEQNKITLLRLQKLLTA